MSIRFTFKSTSLVAIIVAAPIIAGVVLTASSLSSVVKKRQRGKVKCDSQSLLKAPIKSDNNDSIRNLQVMLLTL